MSDSRAGKNDVENLESLRPEARYVYGRNVQDYASGRPDYPPSLYETLRSQCGLNADAQVLEIGPGTGLATRHLLEAGARVTAIEPDSEMSRYLKSALPKAEVIQGSFEDVALVPHSFDLAVSATAFHWVDQSIGIPKLARVLRPGGSLALWWTIFDDPYEVDLFRDALDQRLGESDPGGQKNVQFQMDLESRRSDLRRLGAFEEISRELIRWKVQLNAVQLRSLYGSMMAVRRRPKYQQEHLLALVEELADQQFGGRVRRPFVTVLYRARKPAAL